MIKKVICIVLLGVILVGLTGCDNKDNKNYEKIINDLQNRIVKLEEDNKTLGDKIIEHDTKLSEIEKLNSNINDLETKISYLESQKSTSTNIDQINKKIDDYKKQINQNKSEIEKLSKNSKNNSSSNNEKSDNMTYVVKFLLDDGDKLYLYVYDNEYSESSKKEYSIQVSNGDKYSKFVGRFPNAIKKNVLFNGWYTEKNGKGTRIKYDSTVNLKEDIVLYPYWVEKDAQNIDKDEDFVKPTIKIKNSEVTVNDRTEIDAAIKNNVTYSDDRDTNPKMEYKVIYDESVGHSFEVEIKVTDYNNNSIFDYFTIIIANEKRMSDGKWITYNEFIEFQEKQKEICLKNGLWDSCNIDVDGSNYSIDITNNDVLVRFNAERPFEDDPTMTYFTQLYCYYDYDDLNPGQCFDGLNYVSYNIMPNEYKEFEKTVLPLIKNVLNDIKKEIGYSIKEIYW